MSQPIRFVQDFFNYRKLHIQNQIPANTGYAGFRVLYPLNEPDKWDELGAFLGASYFRLLGKGQRYGAIGARPGAGLRRDRSAGGIPHLHRLVAGQAAAGRQRAARFMPSSTA